MIDHWFIEALHQSSENVIPPILKMRVATGKHFWIFEISYGKMDEKWSDLPLKNITPLRPHRTTTTYIGPLPPTTYLGLVGNLSTLTIFYFFSGIQNTTCACRLKISFSASKQQKIACWLRCGVLYCTGQPVGYYPGCEYCHQLYPVATTINYPRYIHSTSTSISKLKQDFKSLLDH